MTDKYKIGDLKLSPFLEDFCQKCLTRLDSCAALRDFDSGNMLFVGNSVNQEAWGWLLPGALGPDAKDVIVTEAKKKARCVSADFSVTMFLGLMTEQSTGVKTEQAVVFLELEQGNWIIIYNRDNNGITDVKFREFKTGLDKIDTRFANILPSHQALAGATDTGSRGTKDWLH